MPRGIPKDPEAAAARKANKLQTGNNEESPRGKSENKNIRAAIGEETTVNKMSMPDKVRLATGRQARLDASFYQKLPQYQDMQLFWKSDKDGEVERWLHLGAELVPRLNKSLKNFKGFTDKEQGEWECVPVGGGELNYLLFMPYEDYQALVVKPKEDRNQEILDAMGIGKADDGARNMPEVKGIKTYAPNLITGGKGFEQVHDA
jgi:hypothetical protein